MNQLQIRIDEVGAVPVAVIRRQARQNDLPRLVPELCGEVWKLLRGQQIQGDRNVAIYWDRSIRLEAGVECRHPFREDAGMVRSYLPGGKVLVAPHLGPYSSLHRAHEAATAWAGRNRLELAGPCWELYGHWRPEWEAHPELIQTEVCYQIR